METASIIAVVVLMTMALLVSLIPYIPGPAVLWAIGVIFAFFNDFERITLPAVVIMSLFMVIGSTTEFWLRYLGLQSRGGSCWGTLGSIFGGLLGTFVIPIPILGTLIGAIVGALLVEFMRVGQMRHAYMAGRSVLETYLIGIVVEFGMSLGIFSTFLISLWLTA
jgi:uncharacterized protein YqgC (DUF456 family)